MAVPEGAIRFDPSPAEIAAVLSDNSAEVEATVDVDLPEHLLSPEQVELLVQERQPRFVPLGGEGTEGEQAEAEFRICFSELLVCLHRIGWTYCKRHAHFRSQCVSM